MTHTAYKFDTETGPSGTIELALPVPAGTRVEVFVVVQASDDVTALVDAAESSMDFWDNPDDDEDWNNA